jgi:hypothetical protein
MQTLPGAPKGAPAPHRWAYFAQLGRFGPQFDSAHPNNETPTVLGWGFFLPDRAGSRVFLGVLAEACGLQQPPELPVPCHISFSPGHSSLRPRSLELARSPQRPQRRPIQIKGLRADESSGWIAVSGSGGNKFAQTAHLHQRLQQCLSL